jgi:hypothetical protein
VDWAMGENPVGPQDDDHKIAPEQVIEELAEAGWEPLGPTQTGLLPYQYVLILSVSE